MAYKKLEASFKQKWLKALRSNKYKQTKGSLRAKDGYCCLGVACDLLAPQAWSRAIDNRYLHLKQLGFMANEYAEQINLNDRAQKKLITLNDTNNNFIYIANWIEKNL